MIDPIQPMPTRAATIKKVAKGLLPDLRDWHDLQDAAQNAGWCLWLLGCLLLRLVLLLCYPLSVLALYPVVRHDQRLAHRERLAEGERRKALIERLQGRKP